MTDTLTDEIACAIIDDANMRLLCVCSAMRFQIPDDRPHTAELFDPSTPGFAPEGVIARISVEALRAMLVAGVYMDYLQSVVPAARQAFEHGRVTGRREARKTIVDALSLD